MGTDTTKDSVFYKPDEQGNNADGAKVSVKYWQKLGKEKATACNGESAMLETNLKISYHNLWIKGNQTPAQIEATNNKLSEKKINLETEKTNLSQEKESEKVKIKEAQQKISSYRDEISEIKQDPKSFHIEKPDKPGYYIGLVIIIFLSAYLWVFYSSAIYSAFLREFTITETTILNSIFYADALSESLDMGFAAFLLIIASPFVFIALGYMVHRLSDEKENTNKIKIGVMVLVTFIFDSIIAYEITKKIYDLEAVNQTQEMPPYSLGLAFQDVNFWLIIFAGFVVYIIWGFVLKTVTTGYNSMDSVKLAIKKRERFIKETNSEIEEHNNRILKIDTRISEIDGEIKKIDIQLTGRTFDCTVFQNNVYSFLLGWTEYLIFCNKGESEINKANEICEKYIKTVLENDKKWV